MAKKRGQAVPGAQPHLGPWQTRLQQVRVCRHVREHAPCVTRKQVWEHTGPWPCPPPLAPASLAREELCSREFLVEGGAGWTPAPHTWALRKQGLPGPLWGLSLRKLQPTPRHGRLKGRV